MPVIIHVKGLTKQFKEVKAVDNLSFSVNEGEVYGFIGQNGAGKSTTIRMLLTLVEPSAGEIRIFGLELKKHRREILRQVGAIIERPDLYKYLTALENLRLFATMSGIKISEKKLMEQLDIVGLAERAKSKVKTYSQGMKQRLGIATALVHDPQLIILDEPTNGLDPQGIADVRNLILHLSKNLGKTLLISSHLLSEMELIADSMLIIDKGKKITEGSVNDLFNPSDSLVELKATDNIEAYQKLLNTKWGSSITAHSKEKILIRLHSNQVPELAKDLVNLNVGIASLYTRHSLEDYFLSLTTGNQHVGSFKN